MAEKIFCIGLNKTGTTSLEKALKELGFNVAPQRKGELLAIDVLKGNYKEFKKFIDKYEVFQDIPFSIGKTYLFLYENYPNAKFILSVRDNAEQWYNSLIRFHTKRLSKDGLPPRVKDLKESNYCYKGFEYEVSKFIWLRNRKVKEDDFCFDRTNCINYYNERNKKIIEFFKNKQGNLLIINLKEKKSYKKFCQFLGVKPTREYFPHENKSI